jgi:hypothetical protein
VSHFFGDAISTGIYFDDFVRRHHNCYTVAHAFSALRRTVVIGFISDHFQNALAFEAGDALCFSLCGAMIVVVLGAICYRLALTRFDHNARDKRCTDDPNFCGSAGDV